MKQFLKFIKQVLEDKEHHVLTPYYQELEYHYILLLGENDPESKLLLIESILRDIYIFNIVYEKTITI